MKATRITILMNVVLRLFFPRFMRVFNLMRVASVQIAVAGETPPETPPTGATLLRLQKLLDDQTKRIDRLYRALGPMMDDLETEEAEDKRLALESVVNVRHKRIERVGCVNPVVNEFAVLTSDGGVCIFDAAGKPVDRILNPEERLTCLAFSPDGKELLTGTDRGKLLAWNTDQRTNSTVYTNAQPRIDRETRTHPYLGSWILQRLSASFLRGSAFRDPFS